MRWNRLVHGEACGWMPQVKIMSTNAVTTDEPQPWAMAVDRETRWVWRQMWRDVLFLHWSVPATDVQPHIHAELGLDTHDGDAWVSLVLFRLQVAPLGMPPVPGLSSLVEVNLRTYVTRCGQPGIFFLSIHADNLAALALARLLTPLPYQWAGIRQSQSRESCEWELRRAASPSCALSLRAEFDSRPPEPVAGARQDWLLERYRAFTTTSAGILQTAVVDHEPWNVQPVQVQQHHNSLGRPFGLDLHGLPDAAHFCRQMSSRFSQFTPASFVSTASRATISDE